MVLRGFFIFRVLTVNTGAYMLDTRFRSYKREHLVIQLHYDLDPQNPREDDNLGTMLYTSSRYTLGDRQTDMEEIEGICESEDYYWLPVYAYIHSGIVLNTTGFSCRWDSGQCGIIYVSKTDAEPLRAYWESSSYKTFEEYVLFHLKSEVEVYSKYVAGECCGYVIGTLDEGESDIDKTLNVLESCWGYYSEEDAFQAAEDACAYLLADAKAKADFAGPQPMWEI
jgi:hypothetical protein